MKSEDRERVSFIIEAGEALGWGGRGAAKRQF
jgi:hypothetical protein